MLDVDIHFEGGVIGNHRARDGTKMMRSELVRRGNSEPAADRLAFCGGAVERLAQMVEQRRHLSIEGLARFREAQAPGGALDHARSESEFKASDRGAYAGLGPVQ